MKRRALVALNAAVLASVMLGGTALAASVDPVVVPGNPVCSGAGGPSGASLGFDHGVKVDPPAEGTVNVGPGTVTISDIDTGVNPATFTWTSSGVTILAVIVKGGPNANVYYYNPPATTTDSGLHAPNGFSHINFCYNDVPTPTPGSLQVTKAVPDAPEGFTGSFDVHVDCGQDGTFDKTIDFPNPGSVTIDDIPAGAECAVTETDASDPAAGYTWGTVKIDGSPATIPSDGTAHVTVTNPLKLIPPPEVGSLKVTKVIPNVPEGFTGSFDVRISCAGLDPVNTTIDYPTPGFVTVDDIPAGTVCGVLETSRSAAPDGFDWAGPLFSGTVTIVADQTVTAEVTNLLTEQQAGETLGVVKSNSAPIIGGVHTASPGASVTYTLDYTVTGTVTLGVLKDVLPAGVTYTAGSATNSAGDVFVFAGYDAGTRTLTWNAATVSVDGSVTYKVTINAGAAALVQPLKNTATIDSEETAPVSSTSTVFVPAPPLADTAPPTDVEGTSGDASVSGGSMLFILMGLAGLILAVAFVAPTPASFRKRR